MKRIFGLAGTFLISICLLIGCSAKEEALSMGNNAIVLEVDLEHQGVYVKDTDKSTGRLGERCYIDCQNTPVLYCNFDTTDAKNISLADLQPQDEVTINLRETEYQKAAGGSAKAEQIQLTTQRLN